MSTPPSLRLLRSGAVAALTGLALAALAGAPAYAAGELYNPDTDNSAYAWHLNPANEVNAGSYTITLDPPSRTGAPDGNSSLTWGPGVVTVNTGCPVGYRSSSRSFLVTESGLETEIVVPRQGSSVGWGLDGGAITLDSGRDVGDWSALNAAKFPTGTNALVITCDPTGQAGMEYAIPADFTIANAKYFVAYIKVDRATESWEVTSKPGGGTVKVDTSVAASASGVSATSATLSATVTPTDATGTVTFTSGAFSQTAPVSGGTAGVSISGLTPATEYTFAASYSGDDTHNGSTGSVTLTTLAAAGSSNSEVSVTVPTAASTDPAGLSISAKPGAVALSNAAARTQGQNWTASGTLGNVTVTDDRRNAGAGSWTLSGSSTAFVSGANTIAASQLGWTPAKVDGAGTAGAQATDLSSAKPLATGSATAETAVTTTVGAQLALVVPSAAVAGDYKATLTLTLI